MLEDFKISIYIGLAILLFFWNIVIFFNYMRDRIFKKYAFSVTKSFLIFSVILMLLSMFFRIIS